MVEKQVFGKMFKNLRLRQGENGSLVGATLLYSRMDTSGLVKPRKAINFGHLPKMPISVIKDTLHYCYPWF